MEKNMSRKDSLTSHLRVLGCLAATIVGAATLWTGPACSAEESRLVLVREGRPEAAIVLATRATQAAQLAAYELQYHLEKISGARVPIVTDTAEVEEPRILVGQSRYTEQLGLRGGDFKPQEYLIRIAPGTLILMGRDAPDYEKIDYQASLSTPIFPIIDWMVDNSEWFAERATMYAVYDFLERFCRVRWYAPGELGLVHPTWATVMLATGQEVRRAPAMKYRWMTQKRYPAQLYPLAPPAGWTAISHREQRLFYHRHRIGGEPYDSGHTFYGYYRRALIVTLPNASSFTG